MMAMTKTRQLVWWLYIFGGISLLRFLGPALISAPDTGLVLIGAGLLILYGVWSYRLWARRTAIFLFNKVKEASK
jgi:hypothetical protein